MVRAPCCSGEHSGLKKGPWTHEEDQKLTTYLLLNPNTSWRQVPPRAGLLRCGKSCRLRWMNYLRPDIRRGNFTLEEENQIIQLHAAVGNKWAVIASQLPGRTDNEIKNLWNTKLRKQLVHKGLNPINHQPFCNPLLSHFLKQWIKSIENVIITSLTTHSPPTAYNNNSNTNPSYSLHDMSPSSLMSLLPQQFHGSEGLAQPSITETAWEQPNFNNSSWEERSFIENLMLDGSATFPGDLSYCLREEMEKNSNDSLTVEEGTDSIASNAEINLEEGLKYWD